MRNAFFKFLYYFGIPRFLRFLKGNDSITVLSLHRVSPEYDYFFDPIKPDVFERLIKYCIKNFDIVGFNNINTKTLKPKLILSFDDGYYDFIEHALPILSKYNLPSNHNLVNSCLNNNTIIWTQKLNDIFSFLKKNNITEDDFILNNGVKFQNNWITYYISFFKILLKLDSKDRNFVINKLVEKYNIVSDYKMMTWEDAKECMKNYVQIGCHTYNHESLFSISDEDSFKIEISSAIEEMKNKLNSNIEILALPNGQYNDNVIKYIENLNIKFVLFVDNKINYTNNINKKTNIISRLNIINENYYEMVHRIELFHSKLLKR